MFRSLALIASLFVAFPAWAAELVRVSDRSGFAERVVGRDLTRIGISVRVQPGGAITGRALGGSVTGSWEWRDGFFCREMSWGSRSWDWNCQAVYTDGRTVRFVADRGRGDSADLTIR